MTQPSSKRLATEASLANSPTLAQLRAGVKSYRVKNLHPKPASATIGDYFINSDGTGGTATKAIEAAGGYAGRPSYNITWTTGPTADQNSSGPTFQSQGIATVTPGESVTASNYLELTGSAVGDVLVYPQTIIQTSGGTGLVAKFGNPVTLRAGKGKVRLIHPTVIVPPTGARALLTFVIWNGTQIGTATLKVSCLQVEHSRAAGPYRDGNFPDARWTGTVGNSASEAVVAKTDRIYMPGDSHFGQTDGGGYLLPTYVADQLSAVGYGVEVVAAGRGGEPITGILARAGVVPLAVNVAGGSIPAAATAVACTVTPSSTYRTDSGTWPIPGYLTGAGGERIDGDLTQAAGAWTFTRYLAGSATTVTDGTIFKPFTAAEAADLWIVNGGNNLPDYDVIMRDLASLDAACKAVGRPWLFQSLYNNSTQPSGSSGYILVKSINDEIQRRYPNNYVDVRRVLIDQGLSLLGLTGDSADNTAIAEDRIPPQLMADGVHLKPDVRRFVVAPTLISAIQRRRLLAGV